ncbi:MAG: hypothetical protein NZ571_16010, partial [Anaerolineae bacterium]|nr:hypothetical protein [Anaerolineae bacterium]
MGVGTGFYDISEKAGAVTRYDQFTIWSLDPEPTPTRTATRTPTRTFTPSRTPTRTITPSRTPTRTFTLPPTIGASNFDRVSQLRTLSDSALWIRFIVWSPDGRFLASASGDGVIRIWETGGWRLVNRLRGHSDEVTSVSWSPDGRYIASGSADSTIR